MKKTILRILVSAILLADVAGIVVSIIGLINGWKTSTQFSDGFFWAGGILISLGFVSILGRLNQPVIPYSQSGLYLDPAEKTRQWAADISQNYNIVAFLGTSGVLLLGLATLVGSSF